VEGPPPRRHHKPPEIIHDAAPRHQKTMSNPNPLSPQGSLLEQQAKNRSSLRLAMLIVAAHLCLFGGFLILGCKKDDKLHDSLASGDNGGLQNPPPIVDTNPPPIVDTNPPPIVDTNPPVIPPVSNTPPPNFGMQPTNNPAPPPVAQADNSPVPGAATDYKVKKGDFPAKIAKAHGVSLKAFMEANPNLDPKKMRADQIVHIPAGGKSTAGAGDTTGTGATATGPKTDSPHGGSLVEYKVKGGDTLTKIAKAHGTTVKAIRAANKLKDNNIRAGQTLKVPAAALVAPADAGTPAPAPVTPPAGGSGAPLPLLLPPPTNSALPPR
jgi:LysM repeat protein